MSATHNGRSAAAQKRGGETGHRLPGSLYDPEYWAVIGHAEQGAGGEIHRLASQPQTQKVSSEQIPTGRYTRAPSALLPKTVQEALPTAPANLEGARAVDAEFWVDHGEELEQRFNAWAAR